MFRKKKWEIINDLLDEINKDDMLDTCYKDLACIDYAPNIGYRSWIFKYKGVLVALFDEGNGHYAFHMPVNYLDVLVAKMRIIRVCVNRLLYHFGFLKGE